MSLFVSDLVDKAPTETLATFGGSSVCLGIGPEGLGSSYTQVFKLSVIRQCNVGVQGCRGLGVKGFGVYGCR